jgi:geranylgeranyl reductase family protein
MARPLAAEVRPDDEFFDNARRVSVGRTGQLMVGYGSAQTSVHIPPSHFQTWQKRKVCCSGNVCHGVALLCGFVTPSPAAQGKQRLLSYSTFSGQFWRDLMRTDFDVIVVGAGPSGTAAAYRLKRFGYRVLLVDKQQFPRVKPCGGGISIKALNLIPWSIGPVIERAGKKLGIGVSGANTERFEEFECDGYVCTFAVREKFDQFNFEKTLEIGVEFEQLGELTEIDERRDFVRLAIGPRMITSRYVIGADGANSSVRRLLNMGSYFYRGFAIEGLVDCALIGAEPTAEFFFGKVQNGYGWLFPKADHINVGLYTWDDRVTLSKEQLRAYALGRIGTDRLNQIVGFPIGFGGQRYVQSRDRVALAGDAAGFAEPLLGEGIYNALKSGQAAASAFIALDSGRENSLRRAYNRELGPIFNDLTRCEDLKRFFYSNLNGIGYGGLSFPVIKTALMRGAAAGKTMYELTDTFFCRPSSNQYSQLVYAIS